MPTYEYRCKDCGHELEVVQAFTDDALTECPACQGALKKVFGNVGITFKGSGFYKTDSRGGAGTKAASGAGGEAGGDKSAGAGGGADSSSGGDRKPGADGNGGGSTPKDAPATSTKSTPAASPSGS